MLLVDPGLFRRIDSKTCEKVTRRALHYAFDWYLSASFLHDACLMENNAPGALTYPGIMMFTKVDMFGGKQSSQAVQQRCIVYGLRDRSLSQYLDLECFSRQDTKSVANKNSKREHQKIKEVYFFQGNGRIRVQYMKIPPSSQPFPTIRLSKGVDGNDKYKTAELAIAKARSALGKSRMPQTNTGQRRHSIDRGRAESVPNAASLTVIDDVLKKRIVDGSALALGHFAPNATE